MGMFALFLVAIDVFSLLFVLMLFSIVPSFVTTSSGNKEDFKRIYFTAIKSTPIGFILGTVACCILSLSEHPELSWQELNLFTIWFGKFPIISAVIFVVGLLSQFFYYLFKVRPTRTVMPSHIKEPTP